MLVTMAFFSNVELFKRSIKPATTQFNLITYIFIQSFWNKLYLGLFIFSWWKALTLNLIITSLSLRHLYWCSTFSSSFKETSLKNWPALVIMTKKKMKHKVMMNDCAFSTHRIMSSFLTRNLRPYFLQSPRIVAITHHTTSKASLCKSYPTSFTYTFPYNQHIRYAVLCYAMLCYEIE